MSDPTLSLVAHISVKQTLQDPKQKEEILVLLVLKTHIIYPALFKHWMKPFSMKKNMPDFQNLHFVLHVHHEDIRPVLCNFGRCVFDFYST